MVHLPASRLSIDFLNLSIYAQKWTDNKNPQNLGNGITELFPAEVLLADDTLDELDHEYLKLFALLKQQGKLKALELTEILTKVPEFVMKPEAAQEA